MMQSRRGFISMAGAFVLAPSAHAARGEWLLLGTRRINLRTERDVIHVGIGMGLFTGLKLRVAEGSVFMERLQVRFVNGDVTDLPVQTFLRAGDETLPILLPSLVRGIRLIEMTYRRVRLGGEARVTVFGRQA